MQRGIGDVNAENGDVTCCIGEHGCPESIEYTDAVSLNVDVTECIGDSSANGNIGLKIGNRSMLLGDNDVIDADA